MNITNKVYVSCMIYCIRPAWYFVFFFVQSYWIWPPSLSRPMMTPPWRPCTSSPTLTPYRPRSSMSFITRTPTYCWGLPQGPGKRSLLRWLYLECSGNTPKQRWEKKWWLYQSLFYDFHSFCTVWNFGECLLCSLGCVYSSIESLGKRKNGGLESQDWAKTGKKVSLYKKRLYVYVHV